MKLAMIGRLSECLLLSYRTPQASVEPLVPAPLTLITRDDWAFWNIVACRIEAMRPNGLPAPFGISYHHVAYRLLVRAGLADGRTVTGLYFVRSDADSFWVAKLGNLASDFRFHPAAIHHMTDVSQLTFTVNNTVAARADARVRVAANEAPPLGCDSCFSSLAEAKDFLRYQPLGLSCDGRGQWMRFAEVFRDESLWNERAVTVRDAYWAFFDALGQTDARLELATRVAPIDYRWRLGRRERVTCNE